MSFDVFAAHQAIARVKDHSFTTRAIPELGELLEAATKRIAELEGVVSNLESTVDGVQEHAQLSAKHAEATLVQAKQARDDAETLAAQTGTIVQLVSLVESAVRSIEDAEQQVTALQAELTETRSRADAHHEAVQRRLEEVDAERTRLAAVAAQHAAVLERIGSMGWWEGMRKAVKLARG